MMQLTNLRREERIGLGVALAAHVALFAALILRPPSDGIVTPPERVTVTLSDEVGLTSTSPEPASDPAPDTAPIIAETPVEDTPPPQPVTKVLPTPEPVKIVSPRAKATPAPKPSTQPIARPSTKPVGANRFDQAFAKGVAGASGKSDSKTPPAAAIGPAVRSSLAGSIARQLKPRWTAPQGADAEKLVTILAWGLNRDGTLSGAPRVVGQDGITDANRPQAARHAEQAIRAVQLAAPFDLPPEYYDGWKRISSFRFDRKLSQ